MKVNSKGLHLRYPDTHIQLWSRNLHAPMAERILEIPIDVYNGTLCLASCASVISHPARVLIDGLGHLHQSCLLVSVLSVPVSVTALLQMLGL